MQLIEQVLNWTPTNHDMHFFKHVTDMHSTGLNNKYEHRGLILI